MPNLPRLRLPRCTSPGVTATNNLRPAQLPAGQDIAPAVGQPHVGCGLRRAAWQRTVFARSAEPSACGWLLKNSQRMQRRDCAGRWEQK